MENNITKADIKITSPLKLTTALRRLTDKQITTLVDQEVIEYISKFDGNQVGSIFRSVNAIIQNKLWSNDDIQKKLIFGTTKIDNFICTRNEVRNIENLNQVIKSPSLKKQLYYNKYFIKVVINSREIENRFFHSYDIKKVFDGVIESEEFNLLPNDKQLKIIEKLNSYTGYLLLPINFREKYKNIESLLLTSKRENIDTSIISQLTQEELFFLDYISNEKTNHNAIKMYILEFVKERNKSFEELFEDIENKDKLLRMKIQYQLKSPNHYYKFTLEEKVYNILFNEIDDEIIKEKLLKYLTICTQKNSHINPELIYNALKRNLNNNFLTYEGIKYLMSNYNETSKDLKLMFYIKFNLALPNVRYFDGITLDQLSKVNVKHINKLVKYLEDKTQDEPSAIYGACIKMYFIFGYERCLEILNGKYGKYNRIFLDNIAKTNVSKIEMKPEGNKYLPVIDKRFINFMFETPKENHFINMLNDKNGQLYKTWYYLYNNYNEILEKCHNELTLKKVLVILVDEKYDIDRKIITPDNYLLNNNNFLENIVLGNKGYNNSDNNKVLNTIVTIYNQMKRRIESSIPYAKGVSTNGYSYETMKLDDIQIFELGYKANCCFRTLDVAHNHLLHAALCRNGRILLIYDKLGDVAAFSPLKRNGNVLIANSIECVDKEIKTHGILISTAFKEGIEKIVDISKQSKESIDIVCIGRGSYLKPETIPFPDEYKKPTIFEKDDELYKATDSYHGKLDIVYKKDGFKFKDIKDKNPDVSYEEPRNEIKYINFYEDRCNTNIEETINIINAINYSLDKENYIPINKYLLKEVYYSKDWYIANTYQGIIGYYLENDYRAKDEFDKYMDIISKDNPKTLKRTL